MQEEARFVAWADPGKKETHRGGMNAVGFSGADGNRNHDLFDANEALYQLSYSPGVTFP